MRNKIIDDKKRNIIKLLFSICATIFSLTLLSTLQNKKKQHKKILLAMGKNNLTKNNLIDIIGISSTTDEKSLQEIKEFTSSTLKMNCYIPKNLIGKDKLFINTDKIRTEIALHSINNSDAKFIWNVRGGNGSCRVMPILSERIIKNEEKIIIGFSDTTNIHTLMSQKRFEMTTIHWDNGQDAILKTYETEDEKKSLKIFNDIIHNKIDILSYNNLTPLNNLAKKTHTISGKITGGNMSIILSGINTPWQIDTSNKIIIIEDINESFYKIDRMLNSFMNNNIFEGANAIIIGDIKNTKQQYPTDLIQTVIQDFVNELNKPVYRIKNIGHECANYPIVFMKNSEIINNYNNSATLNIYL